MADRRSEMSIIGIVLFGCLVILAIVFLNNGPMDKKSRGREEYWKRYQVN